MKGTIGALVMFSAMAAWGSETTDLPQDGRMPVESRSTWGFALRPVVEVEALGGRKQFSSSTFRGLSKQTEGGVRVTIARTPGATFGIAADYLEARSSKRDEGYTIAAASRELGLGVRGKIDGARIDAVAAGGVALLQTERAAAYAVKTWRSRDQGIGVWYSLGVRAPVTSRIVAGADVRHTIGSVAGRGPSISADAFHVGGTLGVRIGSVAARGHR